MTSVERTAYPVFPRLMMARELYTYFSLSEEELAWVREKTDTDEHQLALALALKCFQKLGRFPKAREVPVAVVDHVRRCLWLDDADESVMPVWATTRTAESHRVLVRKREDVRYAAAKARKIAAKATTEAAWVKNYPPDLINVALEKLPQARLELPAFSTLDAMESAIRGEVNGRIFGTIWSRLGRDGRAALEGLLVVGPGGKSPCRGIPATAADFVQQLKDRHRLAAEALDAGYAENEDLTFDKDGVPALRRLAGVGATFSAVKLGEAIKARRPERTLIAILARTAYWLNWHKHFGPASGHDPKLKSPQDRYVLTTFACGSNLGPYEAARHIAGITAHGDLAGQEPARHPGEAEQGDRRGRQRLHPAGRCQGLG